MKKLTVFLLLFGIVLSGCSQKNKPQFTNFGNKTPIFVIISRYTVTQGNPEIVSLKGGKMTDLVNRIQEAGSHIVPPGTYNCGGVRTKHDIYFINMYFADDSIRTFTNTGVCGSLYDEKDNISLDSEVPSILDQYF